MPRTKGATAFQPDTLTGLGRLVFCLKQVWFATEVDPLIEHPVRVTLVTPNRHRFELIPKGAASWHDRWWLEHDRQPVGGWPEPMPRRGPRMDRKEEISLLFGVLEHYWQEVHHESVFRWQEEVIRRWYSERTTKRLPGDDYDFEAWAKGNLLHRWQKQAAKILKLVDLTVVRVTPSTR